MCTLRMCCISHWLEVSFTHRCSMALSWAHNSEIDLTVFTFTLIWLTTHKCRTLHLTEIRWRKENKILLKNMNNKLEPLNICCFLYDLKICSNNMEKYGPFGLIGQCTNLKYLLNYFNYGLFRELFKIMKWIIFR